jgi:hypothetical protein
MEKLLTLKTSILYIINMEKLSLDHDQNYSDEFKPKSFVFFCIDQNGDMGFEVSFGEKINDVKKFSNLLKNIVSGEFNSIILKQVKEQVGTTPDGVKKYKIIENALQEKNIKDLVINPTSVEINP